MKLTLEDAKRMMEENGGSLYLEDTQITALPEGLTVGGDLDLNGTQITALPEGLTVGGSLDLRDTSITALPEGLTVGGDLYLSHTPITALPEGLTVGGNLYLNGTQITALPEGLAVGGDLYLSHTPITALPEGLAVGDNLYLEDTQITALPEGLTVGGSLDLRRTPITALPEELKVGSYIFSDNPNIKKLLKHVLKDGDYVPGKYLYADGILTHVKNRRKSGAYTYYLGKIKGRNVVSDGTYWAHCRTLREGVADLLYKHAADRGAEQYRHLTLDSVLPFDEAVTMYRVITGACQAGTQQFIERLPELKEAYSVREMIELTRGQYGADKFAEFFGA